ncbi:MAG: DUF3775 domain-containing protein [Rhizomicrobium sp.]
MLDINPEKVRQVITEARMFDAKEEQSDPDSGSNATDDMMADILEDGKDDATLQELMEFIRSLDVDEQIDLVALAWIGRGTYEATELEQALAEARRAHNSRTAEYLTGLPMLGDYLEEGLNAVEELEQGEEDNAG